MSSTAKPTEIFFCYAHEDRSFGYELDKHLSDLRHQGLITSWHNRDISAGTDWTQEIDVHLNRADIILLLVSADFIASDYCYSVEMARALKRHETGEARVIPIILRPTDWQGVLFDRLQALPTDAKPITQWRNREAAFSDITKGIKKIVERLKTVTYETHQDTEKHFFISYNNADRNWAEWIAWQLEEEGYSTVLQAWDFRVGSNFVLDMHKVIKTAKRTIVLLSPNFLKTTYTQPEWAAAFVQDPTGIQGTLLPVRVSECTPRGILASIIYLDLVGLDEKSARRRLLEGVSLSRNRSTTSPAFPGRLQYSLPKEPYFPNALATAKTSQFPEAFPTIWNIPYRRNPYFTGREELLQHLHDTLNSGKAALVIQTIAGLGGIGKTQIAIEYAYRYRSEYTAVLWAKADTYEVLISDFVIIADLLNLPQKSESDQSYATSAVKRWLSKHTGWLLILDNVGDMDPIRELIPTESKGHILLTTRLATSITPRIQVEKMGREEGMLLLLRRTRMIPLDGALEQVTAQEQSEARAIVSELGDLPLALDQAGAYIEETRCSLTNYLTLYRTRRRELLQHRSHLRSDHPEPVATTWSFSFQKVEQANPAAADLLRLCAFLHPDAIPEEIIFDGAVDLDSPLKSVAADPFTFNAALNELRKFSFVHRDLDTKTLSIHPLVQAFLKDNMDEETQLLWAEHAVRAVSHTFPGVDLATWQRCQLFLPHTLICTTLIEQWQMTFAEATKLLNQVGYYLCVRGRYQEAEPLFRRALEIDEQVLELRLPNVASDLNRLAELYRAQGKYTEAEALYKRALDVYTQAQQAKHPDVAELLSNLAGLYSDQGKYTQAMPLYERALTVWEQSLGREHPNSIQALNNLAEIYEAQGRYDQVELLLNKAITIGKHVLESNHPTEAVSLNNLANLYSQQGKYEQAEPLYQRALAIREQVLGAEHSDVATSLNNLASLYSQQGKYEQAEPLYQRALAIREQVLGAEHSDVATSLNNLASLYSQQGKYEQAEPLYERALAIREQVLGAGHPDVATSLNNLANLYSQQGKYERAEPLYERALAIHEQVLGAGHPDVATSLNNLANLYSQQGKYEQAEPLYERALAIRERALGADHPAVATNLHTLAKLYTSMCKFSSAEPLYQRALDIYEQTLGSTHPNVALVLRNYATLLRAMARDEEAAEVEMRAKSLRSR